MISTILFDSIRIPIRLNNQPLIKRTNRYRTNRQQTLSNVGASKKTSKNGRVMSLSIDNSYQNNGI